MKNLIFLAIIFINFTAINTQASLQFTSVPSQIITTDAQKLNAIWTIPSGKIIAAALILQGSGNVGADGDVSGPFLGKGYQGLPAKLSEEIASSLASVGVASLRYAKRGVDDPAQLPNQKFPFLLEDAEAAFKALQAKFPNQKTAIVGFSEGGLVGSLLSTLVKSDALFLLSPVVRPIDEAFSYQFLTWPIEILKNNLDPDYTGVIQASSFLEKQVTTLPLIGQPWEVMDFNHDHQISITDELIPAYQIFYSQIRGLLATPEFSGWYQSLKALPPFSQFASQIKAPIIHIYQGMDDAQVRWNWIVEDMNFLPVKPTLHLYHRLGHCFSPMGGNIGEVKTSGPYSHLMLDELALDALTHLQ